MQRRNHPITRPANPFSPGGGVRLTYSNDARYGPQTTKFQHKRSSVHLVAVLCGGAIAIYGLVSWVASPPPPSPSSPRLTDLAITSKPAEPKMLGTSEALGYKPRLKDDQEERVPYHQPTDEEKEEENRGASGNLNKRAKENRHGEEDDEKFSKRTVDSDPSHSSGTITMKEDEEPHDGEERDQELGLRQMYDEDETSQTAKAGHEYEGLVNDVDQFKERIQADRQEVAEGADHEEDEEDEDQDTEDEEQIVQKRQKGTIKDQTSSGANMDENGNGTDRDDEFGVAIGKFGDAFGPTEDEKPDDTKIKVSGLERHTADGQNEDEEPPALPDDENEEETFLSSVKQAYSFLQSKY